MAGTPTLTSPVVNSGAAVASTGPEIDNVADISARLVAGGSALTMVAATHTGRVILLDTAAGTTITLHAATGSGAHYRFLVSVTPTSNQHRINVTGDDEFVGQIVQAADGGSTVVVYEALNTVDNDRINMNGTTQGGVVGDYIEVIDYLADNWFVHGHTSATGTEATPFAIGAVS